MEADRKSLARPAWAPPALSAARRLAARLGRDVAPARRIRLALESGGPAKSDRQASCSPMPALKFFRPAWTVLSPIHLQIRFGRQSLYYTSAGEGSPPPLWPAVAFARDNEPGHAQPASGDGSIPLPAPASGVASQPPVRPALATAWPTAMKLARPQSPVVGLAPLAQSAPPTRVSASQHEARDSSAGRGIPPQVPSPQFPYDDARLVFSPRGAATAPTHPPATAAVAPSALVDALFDQARQNRGLAGMDLRLLPLTPRRPAKASDEAAMSPEAVSAAASPEPPRMPARLSRDDIGQVAEEVARVLRQRERLERNRRGGY